MADAATPIVPPSGVIRSDGTTTPGALSATSADTATPQAGAGERPAWLPEGFDTPEAFRAAWDKAGGPGLDQGATPATDLQPKPAAEAQPEAPAGRTDDEIRASLKEAGGVYAHPGYEAAAIEFERTGKVSDATLAATAEKLGVPLEFAKAFVDTQTQLREATTHLTGRETERIIADITTVTGGPEGYERFSKWANEGGLTEAQRETLNKALGSDAETAKGLLAGHMQAFRASGNGPAPRDVTLQAGRTPAGDTASEGFASSADMQRAMADPRYRYDQAYVHSVERRVAASKF